MASCRAGKTKAPRMVFGTSTRAHMSVIVLSLMREQRLQGKELTAQTKHSKHHFPPNASTAREPSRMLRLHSRHFGARSRTWHASQYGWPRYTVNPTSAPSSSSATSNAPSPLMLISFGLGLFAFPVPLVIPRGRGFAGEGARKGSPHSAQKKCCSW